MTAFLGPHRTPQGKTTTWITPRRFIDALGGPDSFDLDPCCPSDMPWKTAKRMICQPECGLSIPWEGRVWLNPPYGRGIIEPWLDRMNMHGNGIALVFARPGTEWAQEAFRHAEGVFFLKGRIVFCTSDGNLCVDKDGKPSPAGCDSMFLIYGESNIQVMKSSGLPGILK